MAKENLAIIDLIVKKSVMITFLQTASLKVQINLAVLPSEGVELAEAIVRHHVYLLSSFWHLAYLV